MHTSQLYLKVPKRLKPKTLRGSGNTDKKICPQFEMAKGFSLNSMNFGAGTSNPNCEANCWSSVGITQEANPCPDRVQASRFEI
jgi:hypothetical protein